MVSRIRITERVALVLGAVLLVLLSDAGPAWTHDIPRTAIRELVRLQGHVRPQGDAASHDVMALSVNGRELSFVVGDRQVFIAVGAAGRPTQKEPVQVVVRGARELLARIAGARPNQRVTLLAERRPGSAEMFVASVDLCPE